METSKMLDDGLRQPQSPFLALPAELRLQILDFIYPVKTFTTLTMTISANPRKINEKVLHNNRAISFTTTDPWYTPKAPIDPLRLKAALALPLTCRLLAKESLPLLYQAAHFDIQLYAGQKIYLPQFRRPAQPVDFSFLPRMRSWRFRLECCRTEEGALVPSRDDIVAFMGLMNA